jgi:protein AFG1
MMYRHTNSSLIRRLHPIQHSRTRCHRFNHLHYESRCLTIQSIRFMGDYKNERYLLTNVLREKVERGDLIQDMAQEKAAKRLTKLQQALKGYSNEPIIAQLEEVKRKLEREKEQSDTKNETNEEEKINNSKPIMIPRGLFIHGNVGTGKSYLMDLFFDNTNINKKRRVHFHSFMQDVHQRIHQLKQEFLATKGRNFSVDTSLEANPIHRVATQLADEVALLCFDEFQVTDVADALILSQLFSVLFSRGTVIVATSNRHPSTLYEGGLNRGYFLPFIDLLSHHCIIHNISANTDYRTVISEGIESFFFTSSCKDDALRYEQILKDSWKDGNAEERSINAAFNRTIKARTNSDGKVAKFHFEELCNIELGSSDYRAIAQQFRLIIIDQIPQLSLKEHDQARRFITLVDELYEANCALLCSAASSPNDLFIGRDLEAKADVVEDMEVDLKETLGIDVAQSNGVAVGELASVRELSFAFRRAASRLKEMSSKTHWERREIM